MSFEIVGSAESVAKKIRESVLAALPGASVDVRPGSPGHFELRVVSDAFRGRSRLEQQRLVLAAVAPLMAGDAAPVHAIDRLETLLP